MNLALNRFELPIRISQDRPVTDDELMRLSAENEMIRFERPGDEPEHFIHPTSVHGTGPIAGFELVLSRIWE